MGEPKRKSSNRRPQPDAATSVGIAAKVLDYFRRNAGAMDSVEGIARFWVHEDREVVEACLLDLHARGLLERREIAGTPFYSLPKAAAPFAPPVAGGAAAPGGPATEDGAADPAGAAAPGAPAAAGPVAVPPPAARGDRRPAPAVPGGEGGARILVVDDDEAVRRFLVAALEEVGHQVEAAADGDDALHRFRVRPFDLVVTDVMMPGTSGLEVLRAVKQYSPWTEVIVVTGYASLETAIRALRDGAYDLITKPLPDLEALHRVVRRALEKRRLSAENRMLVDSLQGRNLELTETVARLAAVNEIGRATTGLLDTEELYNALVRLVAQHLKARRVSVFVCEPDTDAMTLVASVGIDDQKAMGRTVRVGEGIAGRVAASEAPLLVENIDKTDLRGLGTGGRYATPSFMITPLMVSYPIRYQRRRVGVINVSDKHSGQPFTDQDLEFLSTLSSQLAVAIENARLVKDMENGYLAALLSLIRAIEDARPETRGHSVRVAELAAEVGEALGLPKPRVDLLVRAAALHEVGRLAGRASQGGRPADFWNAAAAAAAERVLAPIASLKAAREIVLRSADWFDAAPTPFGADQPAIPIEARILAACDDFVRMAPAGSDAETCRRAARALREEAGRKHDPRVVAALCRLAERGGAP
jgi:response regulator RpfG family c-di-GMP phosphodiesterase